MNLGVQFQASSSGFITGVRFYKDSDNTGSHIGSLWSSTGTLLASGTFSGETASGWQELDFSTPGGGHGGYHVCGLLPHQCRALRVHAERAGVGGDERAADRAGQRRRLRLRLGERLPLEHLQRHQLLGRRGVLADSGKHAAGGDDRDASRWVDGQSRSRWRRRRRSPRPVVPSTVSFTVQDSGGNTVAGSVSFNAGNTVATFTPTSSLAASTTYTATVSGAQNASGTPMSSPFTWSFTTGAVSQCPCSIWQNAAPVGCGGRGRHQRGQPGRAVPGQQQRDDHRRPVLQGRRTTPARIPAACGVRPGRCWRRGTFSGEIRVGLAGAGLLQPGGGHGRYHLCGLVPHQIPGTTRSRRAGCPRR